MGQKVSPVGMRVGINRDWHSRWFASNQEYAKFLHEDIRVRAYLEKELKLDLSFYKNNINKIKSQKLQKIFALY